MLSAYCRPVSPRVATRMMDADPITMPSMVRRNLVLLAQKLSKARLMVSRNFTVERALASVRLKVSTAVAVAKETLLLSAESSIAAV
jgi:hypothetical protein